MKLFGSSGGGARLAKNRAKYASQFDGDVAHSGGAAVRTAPAGHAKQKTPFKALGIFLLVILFLEMCYFFVIYTDNGFISKWRSIYIITAMDTNSHKYLATAIIPSDVIADVMDEKKQSEIAQTGQESSWGNQEPQIDEETGETVPAQTIEVNVTVVKEEDPEEVAEAAFYELFYEVEEASFQEYLAQHPEALADGWANLVINEAGLEDEGTSIQTIYGEQVLAIDVPNKILIVRVKGNGYRGVLAVAKDPSKLSLRPASTIWVQGETVGEIASANNGILGMTGSAFIDPDGGGNGGELSGYAMYNGVGDGYGHMQAGHKRIELHEDNLFYIKDANSPTGEGTTDAVEFGPAMIIDGEIVVPAGYDGTHPRACIGQSDKYEILMLGIEGRQALRGILGTTVNECAEILKLHNCMQAMNLDGGTSTMIWYDVENLIRCSNASTPGGRDMPTAWIYEATN